jgi:hypothetical protein
LRAAQLAWNNPRAMILGTLNLKFAVVTGGRRDRERYWLEKFERMRAACGWRPTTVHADQAAQLRLGECWADEVLRVGANDDD